VGSKYPAIDLFATAWKSGDDAAINRITIEVNERGDDAELIELSRAMAATPYGSGQ
jgi:hypothetical protein